MTQLLSNSLTQRRFQTGLLVAFAGVALLLALIGIYGVVSYAVVQRRPEIGVRVVLGAQPGDIKTLMLRHGILTGNGRVRYWTRGSSRPDAIPGEFVV
jgi:ABC-type antimicrobial peptide transport system permease subunit